MKAPIIKTIAGMACALLLGCEPGCASAGPVASKTLQSVVARVDVARLLECGQLGLTKEAAVCLGARAMTEGLKAAMGEALELAERAEEAAHPQAGADDMTEAQRSELAEALDKSMEVLAAEVAAAQ